jgi:flagellar biogenesis protein FliO
MATGDPLQGVDIAQAAGAAFDIRLQVIAGAVIALMALILLFDFAAKNFSDGQKPSLKICFCSSRNSATSPISRRDSIRLVATVKSESPSSRHS